VIDYAEHTVALNNYMPKLMEAMRHKDYALAVGIATEMRGHIHEVIAVARVLDAHEHAKRQAATA
jgi:hypothetical protein